MNLIHRSYRDIDEIDLKYEKPYLFLDSFVNLVRTKFMFKTEKKYLSRVSALKIKKELFLIEKYDREFLYRIHRVNKYLPSLSNAENDNVQEDSY